MDATTWTACKPRDSTFRAVSPFFIPKRAYKNGNPIIHISDTRQHFITFICQHNIVNEIPLGLALEIMLQDAGPCLQVKMSSFGNKGYYNISQKLVKACWYYHAVYYINCSYSVEEWCNTHVRIELSSRTESQGHRSWWWDLMCASSWGHSLFLSRKWAYNIFILTEPIIL